MTRKPLDQEVAVLVEVRHALGTGVHSAGSQCRRFGVQAQADGVVPSVAEHRPLLSPVPTGHRTL